jgi:hypothetical protein
MRFAAVVGREVAEQKFSAHSGVGGASQVVCFHKTILR